MFQEQVAPTHVEHLCALNIDDPPHHVRRTGIICTLGKVFFYRFFPQPVFYMKLLF